MTPTETCSHLRHALLPTDPYDPTNAFSPPGEYDVTPCSMDSVRRAVFRMVSKKAPGFDRTTAGIIKKSWVLISPVLLVLVNECLRAGCFPDPWKSAKVVAILKSADKDPSLAKSYRPISLLPVLGKVIERIACLRLMEKA